MENISTTGRTNHRNGQVARGRRNSRPVESVCANGNLADGFLTTQFLPLYQPSDEPIQYSESIEQDFFKSCSVLAKANSIDLMDFKLKPYPYNIALAYWDVCRQLHRPQRTLSVKIMELDDLSTTIMTAQTCEISYTVFHVPVLPLYNYLKEPAKKSTCGLLLSVYAYLYHCACIPFYRNRETGLHDYYDMLKSCTSEDRDSFTKEEYKNEMQVFKDAKRVGDNIEKKIYNLKHLEELPLRIMRFVPQNQADIKCLKLAKTVLFLMSEFPNENMMKNMHHEEAEDEDCDDGWVHADDIFSFVYSNDDTLSSTILSYISEDYGNKGNADCPCAYRSYHIANEEPLGLEYEAIIIELIDDLNYVLKELK